jgi:uncharacterized membrane protein YgdD (TMEM256/DUF423 family)
MKNQSILLSGAIFIFLAVAIGAFGAHVWKDILETHSTHAIFSTASQYHFIHSLALLWLGLFGKKIANSKLKTVAAYCLTLGTLIFSGSLYYLALSNIRWLGAITPIGGILFLCGWACIICLIIKKDGFKET